MAWLPERFASASRLALVTCFTILFASAAFAFPTSRTGAKMVFDPTTGRTLLFGGITGPDSSGTRYSLNDTWQWTGRRWVPVYTAHAPAKRSFPVMVYDEVNHRALLFGGYDGTTIYNDMWEFRGGDWHPVVTNGTAPSPRRFSSAIYDPVLKRMVMFGGANIDTTFYDTWAFDVTTNSWSQLNSSGPQLIVSSMAYDEERDDILLLGSPLDGKTEMHRLDGTSWTKLTPSVLPECINQGAFLDQPRNDRVLQFGGLCPNGSKSSTTYEWDGSNWTKLDITTSAGQSMGFATAYDKVRHEVLLFGGIDLNERNTTFRFAGRWAIGGEVFYPGPRSLSVMEYDPTTDSILLFGGLNDRLSYRDLWRYKDGRWIPLLSADAPAVCTYPAGVWDTDRKRLVIVCESGDVFEYDNTKWYSFSNLSTKPPARRLSGIAYDPISKKTVLFGGYDRTYLRETWTWNGTEWKKVDTKKRPPGRMLPAMFFDPVSSRVYIFGGIGQPTDEDRVVRYGDMWAFDGTNWTEVTGGNKPAARYGASVELDADRNRIVMFGGKSAEEKYLNEMFEWDGSNWSAVTTQNTPSERMNGGFAWDSTNKRFMYFGGYAGQYFSDMWVLKNNTWSIIPVREGRSPGVQPPDSGGNQTPSRNRDFNIN